MKINRRTDLETDPIFDVRSLSSLLKGKYDNIYIILSTLEHEATDAWEDQGDSFLLINIPKEKVLDASIDYKAEIIKHLPRLSWLQSDELLSYVNERWN